MISFHEQRAVKLAEQQQEPSEKIETRKDLREARLSIIKARRSLDSNIITEGGVQAVPSDVPAGSYIVSFVRSPMLSQRKLEKKKSIIQRKKERNSLDSKFGFSLTNMSSKKSKVSVSSIDTPAFDLATHKFGPLAEDAIAGLGLTMKELRILKKSFDKFDEDQGGYIDHLEFLHALGQTDERGELNNPFTEMVFNALVADPSQGMNFEEFVRMAATVCMFTHTDMIKYVFECFSTNGRFEEPDFHSLSEAVNAVALRGGPRYWSDVLDKYDKVCLITS